MERDLERFAERKFFAQSLVNQNARIDGQANRQDNAGDARQGEDEVEHRQRTHQQDDVYDEREIGDEAGEFVVNHHEHEGDREPHQAGKDTAADRIESERR